MRMDNVLGVLNQQAIILAVQAIQTDDAKLLSEFGLTELDEEMAQQLKALNIEHLNCTHAFRGSLFQVRFDVRQLKNYLKMASEKTREDDQINKAIRAGLRQPMLEMMKGITRRDFAARRQRMGLPEHSKGRIEGLCEEDELSVLTSWAKLKKDIADPLERLLTLYDQTGITLDRAWVVINQLDGQQ